MPTIRELEAAARVEEEALERAHIAHNPIAIAMYSASLRRAISALTKAKEADEREWLARRRS